MCEITKKKKTQNTKQNMVLDAFKTNKKKSKTAHFHIFY